MSASERCIRGITHHIDDLVIDPAVVVLGIQVRELCQSVQAEDQCGVYKMKTVDLLDDQVVNTLRLQSIRNRLRDKNRQHHRYGICQRVRELEHDDGEGHGRALYTVVSQSKPTRSENVL